MRTPSLWLLLASMPAALSAQPVTYFAPAGTKTVEGNGNNTIPWWAGSGTYQQVHDASDLSNVFPGGVGLIKGISFRKDSGLTSSITARTMDVQITCGLTTVSAGTTTTTFATNLGGAPVVVLPYTTINLPALSNVSVPNPQGWLFPFTTVFPYASAGGNLCFELRFKNSTTVASAPCDAVTASASYPALIGTGCVATGQTTAATIGSRSLTMSTGSWTNRLDRGAATASAVMVVGAVQQSFNLGFCATLETVPLVSVGGTTLATGQWSNTLVLGSLLGFPPITIYAQFAWLDTGLPLGLGLSPCGATTLPPSNYVNVSRVWFGASSSGQGNETALTGSTGLYFGLVTGFDV